MEIVSESQHWYYRDGRPCHEMPYAKSNKEKAGQMRATTKADAKKHDLVGSVSKITAMLYKYNLEKWKQEQILESAYTCPLSRKEVTAEEWLAEVWEDAQEHAKVTAEQGKVKHTHVENYIKNQIVPDDPETDRQIMKINDIFFNYGISIIDDLDAERTFATDLWGGFGGMTDFMCKEKAFLGDFKTKDFTLVDGKPTKNGKPYRLHYDDNCLQLVLNALGQGILDPEMFKSTFTHEDFIPTLINIYISRIDDSVFVHEWAEKDIVKALAKAELLVKLWWVEF